MTTDRTVLHLLAVSALALGSCTEEPQPLTLSAPEVSFSNERTSLSATVGDTLQFGVSVTSGSKVKLRWTVDGTLEASTASFGYVCREAGIHTVQFEAANGAGNVGRTYTVDVRDVLSVRLSVGDSTAVKRGQNQTLLVVAVVESGLGVSHEWKVDSTVVSHSAVLNGFVLSEARSYLVGYRGWNSVGSCEKSFTVNVRELPLTIEFSETGSQIQASEGNPLIVTARPLYGGVVVSQSWTLDGQVVGTADSLSLELEQGTYSLEYYAVNSSGDEVRRSWTVNVSERQRVSRMLYDFEDAELPPSTAVSGNDGALSVVANPLKSSKVNGSAYCLANNMSSTSFSTSGLVHLKSIVSGDITAEVMATLTTFSVKVWLGENLYYPRFLFNKTGTAYRPARLNGQTFESESEWRSLVRSSDWNVLEWDASQMDKTDFGTLTGITLRFFVDWSNSNSTADKSVNNRKVYIDDILFYE